MYFVACIAMIAFVVAAGAWYNSAIKLERKNNPRSPSGPDYDERGNNDY